MNKKQIIDIYEKVLNITKRFPIGFYNDNPIELQRKRKIILEYVLKQKLGFTKSEACSFLNIKLAQKYRIYNLERTINKKFAVSDIINCVYNDIQLEFTENTYQYNSYFNETKSRLKRFIDKKQLSIEFIMTKLSTDYLYANGFGELKDITLSDLILDIYPELKPWHLKYIKKNYYTKEIFMKYLEYVIEEIAIERDITKQEVACQVSKYELDRYLRTDSIQGRLNVSMKEMIMERYNLNILDIKMKEIGFYKKEKNIRLVLQSLSNRYNVYIKYIPFKILNIGLSRRVITSLGGIISIQQKYSNIKPSVNLKNNKYIL